MVLARSLNGSLIQRIVPLCPHRIQASSKAVSHSLQMRSSRVDPLGILSRRSLSENGATESTERLLRGSESAFSGLHLFRDEMRTSQVSPQRSPGGWPLTSERWSSWQASGWGAPDYPLRSCATTSSDSRRHARTICALNSRNRVSHSIRTSRSGWFLSGRCSGMTPSSGSTHTSCLR